jgi:hypothetical protein
MTSIEEQILRATKEIVVKFIEVGRVSPTSFNESFKTIYKTISESVRGDESQEENKRE